MGTGLQQIYYIVGVVGFVLAAILAVVAVVYFFRAGIRAVRADLSGKTRQRGLEERAGGPRRVRGAKGELLQESEWQGDIARGQLDASAGTDAITDEHLSSGSASSSSGMYPAQVPSAPEQPMPEANGQAQAQTQAQAVAPNGLPRFAVTRRCVIVHARSVIDSTGTERVLDGAFVSAVAEERSVS